MPGAKRNGFRIGVMVSGHGRGSNLQAILDACSSSEILGEVAEEHLAV